MDARFMETAERAYDRIEGEWEASMDGMSCGDCDRFEQVHPVRCFARVLCRELDALMITQPHVLRDKASVLRDVESMLDAAQEYHGWCTACGMMTAVDVDVDGCEHWLPKGGGAA